MGGMPTSIGERLRYWRRRRGKSQQTVAGLAGLSQSYVSKVEAGTKTVDRRSTLAALAEALDVSVAELTGQPGDPTDPARARAASAVPAIRDALIMREAGECDPTSPGLPVADALAASARYDFATLAPMLPAMLRGLSGVELVLAARAANVCLRHLGYLDLAREAARLGLAAARDTDDPTWLAVAEHTRVISLPPESASTGARLAERAADAVQRYIGDPEARQVYGMLHLAAALRHAVAQQASDVDHIQEAQAEADSLGEPDGSGLADMAFGPTNVALWRMAVEFEHGDPRRAIEVAGSVEPGRLANRDRQAAYWADLGHALTVIGKRDDEAVTAFARAEVLAPQYVRLRPTVRDSVRAVVRRTRRNAVSRPLARLAESLAVDAAA